MYLLLFFPLSPPLKLHEFAAENRGGRGVQARLSVVEDIREIISKLAEVVFRYYKIRRQLLADWFCNCLFKVPSL